MSRVENKKQKKARKKGTLLPMIIIIVLLVLAGSFVNRLMADESELQEQGFFGKDKNSRLNILVFGIDAISKEAAKNTRSDSIMLLSVDSSGKNPVMISIPRDTRVEIPGRKNPDKINHAHSFGGPNLLVATVERLFNIKVHHYVRINYRSVVQVVDALGGIEIDVPMDMKYNDPYDSPPLHINIKKGLQTLNGKDSVHFLRFRKGYANQDLGRIEAQQQFVKALVDKVISPVTLVKIPQLIDIFHNNVDTNISKAKMLSYGTTALRVKSEDIVKMTLPGKPSTISGVSYYIIDKNELAIIQKEHLANKSKVEYNIEVLNGSGIIGVANKYGKQLEEAGIKVAAKGNYEGAMVENSFIEYIDGFKEEAQEVASRLKINKIIKVKTIKEGIQVRVIIGEDLK